MNLIKNKQGGDKIISVYWFVILFLVAAGVSYMVVSFYGKPYDIRGLEANALANRVTDCISSGGYLNEESLTPGFSSGLLEKCNLNFEVEDMYDWREQGQYFVEVEILEFNSQEKVSETSAGNVNLKDFCELPSKNSPTCLKRSFYSLDKKGVQYQINLLSIVRKTEKNAK